MRSVYALRHVTTLVQSRSNWVDFKSRLIRNVSYANSLHQYEGDGKTKASILNTNADFGLMVTAFSRYGFRLNNDMVVMGPIAIFPRSVLSWNVDTYENIDKGSLSLFYMLEPKIDILIIGIGDQNITPTFSKKIFEFMKKYNISVEILRTEQACATFNFLNSENRMVASALLPPVCVKYNENDVLQSKLRQNSLYNQQI